MTKIQLTKSEIEHVQSKISGLGRDLNSMSESVGRLARNLDMQISARQDIEERLIKIKGDLKQQADMITACSQFLGSALNKFSAIDDQYRPQVQAGALVPTGGSNTGADILSQLTTGNDQQIILNWITQQGIENAFENFELFADYLNSYEPSGLAGLFLSEEQQENISLYLSEFEDYLIGTRKNIKGIIKMLEAYDIKVPEGFASFFTDKEVGKIFDYLELWDEGTDVLDALGTDEAGEEIWDFVKKYTKKGLEKAWGSNYGAKWVVNCFATLGENILSAGDYFSTDATAGENILGGLDYVTSIVMSGTEATLDMSVDLLDGIGSIFGADLEGYLSDTYGGEKGESILNMFEEIRDTYFEAFGTIGFVDTMLATRRGLSLPYILDYYGITENAYGTYEALNEAAVGAVHTAVDTGIGIVEDAVSDFLGLFK